MTAPNGTRSALHDLNLFCARSQHSHACLVDPYPRRVASVLFVIDALVSSDHQPATVATLVRAHRALRGLTFGSPLCRPPCSVGAWMCCTRGGKSDGTREAGVVQQGCDRMRQNVSKRPRWSVARLRACIDASRTERNDDEPPKLN
jgi:hypothetical protein